MDETKIILVDDHALFRIGERAVINERMPGVVIDAEFSSGVDLLRYLETSPKIDIILLDIIMPEIDGIEIAKILRKKYPDIKIIMLSSEVSQQAIIDLLEIGVDGYLSKIAIQDDLVVALKSVLSGSQYFGRSVAKIIYETYVAVSQSNDSNHKTEELHDSKVSLTQREIEVIELLCDGITTREIASKLKVSTRTIDNHRANILQKLGFHNTIELVKYAIKEGIVVL